MKRISLKYYLRGFFNNLSLSSSLNFQLLIMGNSSLKVATNQINSFHKTTKGLVLNKNEPLNKWLVFEYLTSYSSPNPS